MLPSAPFQSKPNWSPGFALAMRVAGRALGPQLSAVLLAPLLGFGVETWRIALGKGVPPSTPFPKNDWPLIVIR